jgi:SAM-dependent methyltransferase
MSRYKKNSSKNKLLKNKKNILREFNIDKYRYIYDQLKKKKYYLKNVEQYLYNSKIKYLKLNKEKKIVNNYLNHYSKKIKNIIDLGAGYGSKSLPLLKKKKFKDIKFYLCDISVYAKKLAKKIINSERNIKKKINFFVWDFYNSKKIPHNCPRDALIFTCYSLHYRKKLNSTFLKNILRLKPKLVINFEPLYEIQSNKVGIEKKIKNYIEKNNYTLNLLYILKKFESKKKIKILKIKKNIFGENKLLPFSIIIWKPF